MRDQLEVHLIKYETSFTFNNSQLASACTQILVVPRSTVGINLHFWKYNRKRQIQSDVSNKKERRQGNGG